VSQFHVLLLLVAINVSKTGGFRIRSNAFDPCLVKNKSNDSIYSLLIVLKK
jgi:hypothetical protein